LILSQIGYSLSHYEFIYLLLAVLLSFSHSQQKTVFWQRGLSTLFIVGGRCDQLWHRDLDDSL
jgi:hypothetical protein